MQRHPNDSATVLPDPHADKTSALFVPVELRQAFSEIDDDTEDDFKRELYSEITEPMVRTVAGRPRVINHRSNENDFEIALHLMKVAEASHRVGRDAERQASAERTRRTHTCAMCGRIDASARSDGMVVGGVDAWCQRCRDEWRRQEAEAHASLTVNGKTIGELIERARKAATP